MLLALAVSVLSKAGAVLSIMGAAARASAAVRNRSLPSAADLEILGIEKMPDISRI